MLKMMKMDFNTRVGSFCVDTAEEIAKLPTLNSPGQDNLNTVYCAGMGSDCLVIGEESVYILNGNNKWVKFGSGGGSSGNVLDFLPHPEGIYAYWDFEHGVENTTWTDQLNNTVLTCKDGASFSVDSGTIQAIGAVNVSRNSAAVLNFDTEFVVIYLVKDFSSVNDATYLLCSDKSSVGIVYNIQYLTTPRFIIAGGNSVNMYPENSDIQAVAFIKTPTTGQIAIKNDKIESQVSNTVFDPTFGLAYQCPIKALLLSTGTNNVDNIQANLKALEEKYYPA